MKFGGDLNAILCTVFLFFSHGYFYHLILKTTAKLMAPEAIVGELAALKIDANIIDFYKCFDGVICNILLKMASPYCGNAGASIERTPASFI
jgi:hypothetical protein